MISITDQQYPQQGLRDLAAKLALDAGKHVHIYEGEQLFCLMDRCVYLEDE